MKVVVSLLALLVAAGVAHAQHTELREGLDQAEVSLIKAIKIAEKETDGKAFEAIFEPDDEGIYVVHVLKEGEVLQVIISAESGKVLEVNNEEEEDEDEGEEEEDEGDETEHREWLHEMIERSEISITEAIEKAEKEAEGKAVAAELTDWEDETPIYFVHVLAKEELLGVVVNAESGRVLEVEEIKEDDEEEGEEEDEDEGEDEDEEDEDDEGEEDDG